MPEAHLKDCSSVGCLGVHLEDPVIQSSAVRNPSILVESLGSMLLLLLLAKSLGQGAERALPSKLPLNNLDLT